MPGLLVKFSSAEEFIGELERLRKCEQLNPCKTSPARLTVRRSRNATLPIYDATVVCTVFGPVSYPEINGIIKLERHVGGGMYGMEETKKLEATVEALVAQISDELTALGFVVAPGLLEYDKDLEGRQ